MKILIYIEMIIRYLVRKEKSVFIPDLFNQYSEEILIDLENYAGNTEARQKSRTIGIIY